MYYVISTMYLCCLFSHHLVSCAVACSRRAQTAKITFSLPVCPLSGDLTRNFLSNHDDEASDSWTHNDEQLVPRNSYKAQADLEVDSFGPEGPGGPESLAFMRPGRSFISDEVLEALRTSDRKGRDVVVGLSNACCKWGCSKSEISSLC